MTEQTNKAVTDQMTLYFSVGYWILIVFLLAMGVFADEDFMNALCWGGLNTLSKVQLVVVIGQAVAIWGIFYGLTFIRVTSDIIEARYLLFTRRTLDRGTSYLRKYSSTGFVVSDASGARIHIHRLMVRSEALHHLLTHDVAARWLAVDLNDGIQSSSGMQFANRLRIFKALLILCALFVSGLWLIANVTGGLLDAISGRGPFNGVDAFLFILGITIIAGCSIRMALIWRAVKSPRR